MKYKNRAPKPLPNVFYIYRILFSADWYFAKCLFLAGNLFIYAPNSVTQSIEVSSLARYVTRPMLCVTLEWGHTTSKTWAHSTSWRTEFSLEIKTLSLD